MPILSLGALSEDSNAKRKEIKELMKW
jgi:hypothetical protein